MESRGGGYWAPARGGEPALGLHTLEARGPECLLASK